MDRFAHRPAASEVEKKSAFGRGAGRNSLYSKGHFRRRPPKEASLLNLSARHGIVLIFTISTLVLLALLGLALLRLLQFQALRAGTTVDGTSARLAALSGMEYAAARLLQDPYTGCSNDAAARGDDWTFRDEAPLERAANVSYAHGDLWQEGLPADGHWGPGDVFNPAVHDRDGDGVFGSWSGRMRGGALPHLRFSLRVASEGGKIPLNAGFIDAQNRNGGDPDHQDLTFALHRGLAHTLDNLGALLLPAGHPRLWQIQDSNPDEPILYSLLGEDIVASRPVGGYRSLEHLRQVLSSLGGGLWYPDGFGIDPILPHVTVQTAAGPPQAGPPWRAYREWIPFQDMYTWTPASHVELAGASRETLQALWRYLCLDPSQPFPMKDFWEVTAAMEQDPRSGNVIPKTYGVSSLILWPDEASRLADTALAYRSGLPARDFTWKGLFQAVADRARSFDPVYPAWDPGDGGIFRSGLDPGTELMAHARYPQLKADMLFAAICPDAHPFPMDGPFGWPSWGVARADGSGTSGPYGVYVDAGNLRRIRLPNPLDGVAEYPGVKDSPFYLQGDSLWPLSLTLAPPVCFQVESLGAGHAAAARASCRGTLRTGETLWLTSQNDFENWSGAETIPALGIRASGRGARPVEPDAMRPFLPYPAIASLPRWNLGSYPTGVAPIPSANSAHSRMLGALMLATRETGLCDADFYWPFSESVAGPQEFSCESATGRTVFPWKNQTGQPIDPNVGRCDSPNRHHLKFNPFMVTGEGGRGLILREANQGGFPGFADGERVRGLTLEGWCCPQRGSTSSKLELISFNDNQNGEKIVLEAAHFTGNPPVVRVQTAVIWYPVGEGPPNQSQQLLTDDVYTDLAESPSGGGRFHHVAVTFEETGTNPNETSVILYTDGEAVGAPITFDYTMQGTRDEMLFVSKFDDVRVYAQPLPPGEIASRYALGRFVSSGSYTSPLYSLDSEAELRHCFWTGIFPEGMSPALRLEVTGYENADGTGASATAPIDRGAEGTATLASLGMRPRVRSFRYTLRLDAGPSAGPLLDTPVLESIGFAYRRRGRHPSWADWTANR